MNEAQERRMAQLQAEKHGGDFATAPPAMEMPGNPMEALAQTGELLQALVGTLQSIDAHLANIEAHTAEANEGIRKIKLPGFLGKG